MSKLISPFVKYLRNQKQVYFSKSLIEYSKINFQYSSATSWNVRKCTVCPQSHLLWWYILCEETIIHRECFGICVGEHWPVGMLDNICDSLYLFVSMFASGSCLELVPLWTSNDTWCCMLAMTVTVDIKQYLVLYVGNDSHR